MAFDKDAYRDHYLKPKSRLKLAALQDDLFERYAIALPMSDAEIVATVKAVRSFWGSQQAGTPAAKYAKLCLAADEDLKQQKVLSGPHRGKDMASAAWWQQKQDELDSEAATRVTKLAALLKDSNGTFGVVTRSYLDTCAERLTLNRAQAAKAAADARLELVDDVDIPDGPPIGQYAQLESELGVGQVRTLPELVHPGTAVFRIVERFEAVDDPTARFDLAAVKAQAQEASRQGNSATWNARRSALNLLRSAMESGADIRQVALYHLARSATASGVPGPAGIKSELIGRGVEDRDANVLAVVLADRLGVAGASGVGRVEQLLQDGRLREAIVLGEGLATDGSDKVKELQARIEKAKVKLEKLLADAHRLLTVPDEVGAASKARDVAAISGEDADELMALVPLAPPRDVTVDADGGMVRLHWQPNVGHDADTAYRVVRSIDGPPRSEANGSPIAWEAGTSVTDGDPPVATTLHYGVFAVAPGRPSSRPASAAFVSLPPVFDARVENGPDWVSAHWSAHRHVHHVEAARVDGGAASQVPVQVGSANLTGLTEGVSVHLELTAVYEQRDGTRLRSAPVLVAGTPRAEAKPLENLRADPVVGPNGIQVRFTWTPVDRSEVRLKRSGSSSRWNVGEMISAEDLAAWGDDVTGPTDAASGKVSLTATLPAGVSYVVPFSVGGTGIKVGRTRSVGVTDPVVGLEATAFQGFARLAWTWPETSSLAEIAWERDDPGDDAVGLETISRPDYDKTGARVPLGPAPCRVSVRALMVLDGDRFSSPPATMTVDHVAKRPVSYRITSSPRIGVLGGRSKRVTFSSDQDAGPLHIAIVASPGIVMPSSPEQGVIILDETVTLEAGTSQQFTASVPRSVGRTYWVRCFLLSGDAHLQDPPINTLKEG